MGPYEYVVESIAGEYAYLRRTDIYDNGEPMMIAMALLPDGVDVGTRLRWRTWCIPCWSEGGWVDFSAVFPYNMGWILISFGGTVRYGITA